MESPKHATKKAKLHSKLYLDVKTQAISFKTQEKTQNSRKKLRVWEALAPYVSPSGVKKMPDSSKNSKIKPKTLKTQAKA